MQNRKSGAPLRIDLVDEKGIRMAEIVSDRIEIRNTRDALDLMANCDYQGARRIIIHARNLTPDFFDLKTGIAGDILQKFSTYDVKLAIVGDQTKHASKSMQAFIHESNKTGRINFVNSVEEAREKLK